MGKYIVWLCNLFTLLSSCGSPSTKNPIVATPDTLLVRAMRITSSGKPNPDEMIQINDTLFLDKTEVSTAAFDEFVKSTGYIPSSSYQIKIRDSLIEPGSLVFNRSAQDLSLSEIWKWKPSASYLYPQGEDQAISPDNNPAVHVSYYDALAYCRYKGKEVPPIEWFELASGKVSSGVTWNFWQGIFPFRDNGTDGYQGPAPVSSGSIGLKHFYGNVWEWTSTSRGGEYRQFGGSWMCSESYCKGWDDRVENWAAADVGYEHVGIRCGCVK